MKSHTGWTALVALGALAFTAAVTSPAAPAQNLLVNGDFEKGNTGFKSGYAFGDVSGPGTFNIGGNPSRAPGAYGDWCNCGSHAGSNIMMIVNGATSASVAIWEETVTVAPSTAYTFSYWGAEVDHDSGSLPHLSLSINGKVVGDTTFPERSPDNGGHWQKYQFTWNSGASRSAHLALFDLNTEATWNDFAIDDLSFSASAAGAGNASASAKGGSSPGVITSNAQVMIKNEQGAEIPLKPEEKIAFMFMAAISSLEGDCKLHLNRACSLAELIAGSNSHNGDVGKFKYDPRQDPNYKYVVVVAGGAWTASAEPQHAGLGGFFCACQGMIPNCYYNAKGAASATSTRVGDSSVAGDGFSVE